MKNRVGMKNNQTDYLPDIRTQTVITALSGKFSCCDSCMLLWICNTPPPVFKRKHHIFMAKNKGCAMPPGVVCRKHDTKNQMKNYCIHFERS